MSVIGSNILAGASGSQGYQISRSVRLRSSASAYFNRTNNASTNRTTWTYSTWVKRGKLSAFQALFAFRNAPGTYSEFWFDASDNLHWDDYSSAVIQTSLISSAVYRDPSAWYHVVLAYDSSNATAANRVKMYVNGVQITAFGTAIYPAQNTLSMWNYPSVSVALGAEIYTPAYYFDGYLTEVNFINGQALTPSAFGETDLITGVWKPKRYTGTYGTNGFFLNFSDPSAATAAAIGKDYSGNGNNWTPNNISVTAGVAYDSMLDVPTMWDDGGNGRGNYAVMNPLSKDGANIAISNGNLTVTKTASSTQEVSFNTIGVSSGKYYWEVLPTAFTWLALGVGSGLTVAGGSGKNPANRVNWINGSGIYNNAGTQLNATTYVANDVIGFALDITNNTLGCYKNGVLIYTVTSLFTQMGLVSGDNIFTFTQHDATSNTATVQFNFGQRPFAYTPPTGFKALNTQNLPASTIVKGSLHFNALLDTGANIKAAANAAYTYVLEWIKDRANANNHQLADTNRGLTAILQSNTTAAETTYTAPSGSSVAWVWNLLSAAVTNTAGSITSQVSANVSAGISVVTFTAQTSGTGTVGHGLGVAPSLIITKPRVTAIGWTTYHQSLGNTAYVQLNTTAASAVSVTAWNNTSPTSSIITLGSGFANIGTYVAYCFAEVAGFSKFGILTANGAADNVFAFTGFLPRLVMLKRTDSTSNWIIWDTARNTYNVLGAELYPNLANAESTVADIDLLSNGFKLRNASFTGTWIYAAFATVPFKNSLAF